MSCLAAIDVGSNAIRLSVADVSPVGTLRDSAYHRYAVRLGSDVFSRGGISDPNRRRLLEVFEEIASRMEQWRVGAYRAVATSAMRDARNGDRVAASVRRATGVELQIISGSEEGRLSQNALVRALGSVAPETLLVDLGGGSLEVHRAGDGLDRSLPFGTVRLIQHYPQLAERMNRRDVTAMRRRVRDQLREQLQGGEARLAVGTGGNLDVLSRLAPQQCGLYPGIDLRRLAGVASRIASVPTEMRIRAFGLRPDRADVILPAALVILAVRDLFGLRRFVVPGTGLRESILQSLADAAADAGNVRELLIRFGRDPTERDRSARTAQRLFDLLAPVHGLWAQARRPLLAAAYLGDLGSAVDPAATVEHTAYLLEHLAGLDLDERGRAVAACAAADAMGADTRAYRNTVAVPDRHVADLLGTMLRLANRLVEHGAGDLRVDLTRTPPTVETGLGRPLRSPDVKRLRELLGIPLRIR
ncbi:MAG: hypothetical protein V3T05_14190 [Myxococcota bacterium]